ncbi:MAG: 5-dehydro-4-deoxy-D-glucuronate isomerase [Proteobacteria bacterium]|nr:5-dehydro-4-deoxy-D-glucuronate isomerase [Pseudomonadota bacterium]
MEVRHPVHPEHMMMFDTEELRHHFLVEGLFIPSQSKLVYCFYDRLIVGGVCPVGPVSLTVDPKVIGAEFLLERRELGVINIGHSGRVVADGKAFELARGEGLYVGLGTRDLRFESLDVARPAKFYLNSAPAHAQLPTVKIALADAEPVVMGEAATSNRRTIRKYIHPGGVKSCQLVMGMTTLDTGSVWNTMPVHTHQRRMEAYLYFDMPTDTVVFHLMGEPEETRHLVVRDGEVVLSPSWSIHSGAGTANYTFIWGMAGENQNFSDMDHVPMARLR